MTKASADWHLQIDGEVERPTNFTMADLQQFPWVSRQYVLECASNWGRGMIPAFQQADWWTLGALRCAPCAMPCCIVLHRAALCYTLLPCAALIVLVLHCIVKSSALYSSASTPLLLVAALFADWCTLGGVSCSNWTGVLLSDLLAHIGVKSSAVFVAYFGEDESTSRGVPLSKAIDGHTMLAWAMNGLTV